MPNVDKQVTHFGDGTECCGAPHQSRSQARRTAIQKEGAPPTSPSIQERLRRELLDTLHNDERHVIERDEARAELERLRKVERAARDYFDAVDRGYPFTPNLGAIRTALAFPDPTSSKPNDAQSGEQR